MNDTYKSFSLRRVGCLLSYSFKEWKEWYIYLPLGCLIIGISHILNSIYVVNPKSIEYNDPIHFMNVSNYIHDSWGFYIIYILVLVFVVFQMLSKFIKKGDSTFYRSIPTTALEKMISFFIEILIMVLLVVSMKLLSLVLDGIACAIYNYNEWTDILPAIKDYFTPVLGIDVSGKASFGFNFYKIIDESWKSNGWFVWGVSFNKKLAFVSLIILVIAALCLIKKPKRITSRMSKVLYIIDFLICWGIIIFSSYLNKDILRMIIGFGPWCYNYEYGWMIQTFVLLLWTSFWLFVMYVGIKRGESR